MKRSKAAVIIVLIAIAGTLVSCKDSTPNINGKKYEFSIVQKEDIPEKLMEQIELQKINAFQVTYLDSEYLYAAVGYGEQKTGGYSIEVERLQEEGETLYLETNLIGPKEDVVVKNKPTYPYVVIKTEAINKDISFL